MLTMMMHCVDFDGTNMLTILSLQNIYFTQIFIRDEENLNISSTTVEKPNLIKMNKWFKFMVTELS